MSINDALASSDISGSDSLNLNSSLDMENLDISQSMSASEIDGFLTDQSGTDFDSDTSSLDLNADFDSSAALDAGSAWDINGPEKFQPGATDAFGDQLASIDSPTGQATGDSWSYSYSVGDSADVGSVDTPNLSAGAVDDSVFRTGGEGSAAAESHAAPTPTSFSIAAFGLMAAGVFRRRRKL